MQADETETFDIEFRSMGDPKMEDTDRIYRRELVCPVVFRISRGRQAFDVTVYVDKLAVAAVDYVKIAAHQLHLDFKRLAEQTADQRLPDDQVPSRPKTPAADDWPNF